MGCRQWNFFCHRRGSFILSERIGMQASSQLEQEIVQCLRTERDRKYM